MLPEYQGQGIGKELVRRMVSTLYSMHAIDITCDEALVPFYASLGFTPLMAMVRRNHVNQDARSAHQLR